MNLLRLSIFGLALGGGLITTNTASAAWNNVFQVCCNDCGPPRASYYAPPACPQACPQPEARVSYVQRCYYQPVTEYIQKSYYEPVRQNVTSYYYEPVTEYRYSSYYDPCTGCPQKVCTPVTAYRLRSQCNSVTSYVLRTSVVPVTSLKPVTVQQPVVTYYYPPQIVGSATPSYSPLIPYSETPKVEEYRSNPPGVMPQNSSDTTIPPPNVPTGPGTSFPRPGTNTNLRPDKTASRSSVVTVRGEVVLADQLTPRGNVKLVFMNADKPEQKEYVTANAYGEFDVRLAAGKWYLYVGGENGRATYHKQVSLGDRDTYDYKVVSR
ncbi:MAG TPA: hypothetical protein VG122_03945 [Gemmata sp.]|jgi:hypothetical protein|nr:hypothetical protein [Gemmata sp.]